MRIGLFGGTYNPIHFGHLRVATEVREAFELDRIILIPAALPPHKQTGEIAPSSHRLKMVHLAVDDDASLEISDIELRRSGPSYTIDTVADYQRRLAPGARIFLIMGLDAVLEIDTWKSYRRLLAGTPLIVINRPDPSGRTISQGWRHLERYLKSEVSADYAYSAEENAMVATAMAPIYIQNVSALDISSTKIRKLAASGRSIRYLVPRAVDDYIAAEGLYA